MSVSRLYHVHTEAVTTRFWDETRGCYVRRTVAFVACCECGWRSGYRELYGLARAEGEWHRGEHDV